jgi:hypothetical protein
VAKAFQRKGKGYAGRLDPGERALIMGLMEQVLHMVEPHDDAAATGQADAFDDIVADLGDLGISLAPDERRERAREGDEPAYDSPEQSSPRARERDSALERDPALDRLFPPGHRDDPSVADEFHRLTEHSLRSRKAHNLSSAIEALRAVQDDRVRLDNDQAVAFLVALTDVRLVLGDRLGLVEDQDAERLDALAASMDPEDPLRYAMAIYDFLTWLQETLVHALGPSAGR